MVKKYIAELTPDERQELLTLTSRGKASARKIKRAHILLLAAEGRKDVEIVAALHTSLRTVERTRQRFVLEGLAAALSGRPQPGAKCKLDVKGKAILETLAQSKPPAGRKRWTLQLLTERLVELNVVDSVSDETVRKHLKKNVWHPGSRKSGAFPRSGQNSFGAWKMCWSCTPNRKTHGGLEFASMKCLTSWWLKNACLYPYKLENPGATITNIVAWARVICFCASTLLRAGVISKPLSGALNRISPTV